MITFTVKTLNFAGPQRKPPCLTQYVLDYKENNLHSSEVQEAVQESAEFSALTDLIHTLLCLVFI